MTMFDGTPLEIEAIRLWRNGEDVERICRATRMQPGSLVTLYRRYLDYRYSRLQDPEECRHVRGADIDQIEALIETYSREALRGNLKAAQFVLAALGQKARLEAGYHDFDRERFAEVGRHTPDVRRIAMTASEERQARLADARAQGIEVDPAAILAGSLIQTAG
jgi:hypothetical protein